MCFWIPNGWMKPRRYSPTFTPGITAASPLRWPTSWKYALVACVTVYVALNLMRNRAALRQPNPVRLDSPLDVLWGAEQLAACLRQPHELLKRSCIQARNSPACGIDIDDLCTRPVWNDGN